MMTRPPPVRHSWPENDGKRTSSPIEVKDGNKKSRSVYLVESPGGTLRQESPTKVYQPEIEKLRVSPLPARPSPRRHNERPLYEQQRPVKPTVADLLIMGIRRGAEKERDYRLRIHQILQCDPQLRLLCPLENSPCVAGMQKAVDRATHMSHVLAPEQIEQDGMRLRGPTEAIAKELTDQRPGQGTSRIRAERREERKQRDKHLDDRHYYLISSSKRMQTIMGLVNFNTFSPLVKLPYYETNHAMRVEGFSGDAPSLYSTLTGACRGYGCKKLNIDSISFREIVDLRFKTLGPSPYGDCSHVSSPIMELDAAQGEISLWETNIIDGLGQRRSWMWFEITKPLFSIDGRRPSPLRDMPQSRVVFAIPTLQVMKLKEE